MKKRVAIKIGSNVLTKENGMLDITQMSMLVDQIATLYEKDYEVIIISSGAVASGRSEIKHPHKLDTVSQRQLFSAVGQAKLINRYYDFFKYHNIVCGQVLATKDDFGTRTHYLNQRNCMQVMLENGVIPIINENDTIAVSELMFTDNDELSGMIAAMMNCQQLIILSNIDGVYDGDPKDKTSQVIKTITSTDNIEQYIQSSKSSAGRGGMQTKFNIARKVAEEGIEVIIANGKQKDILIELFSKPDTLCTRFLPSEKPISSIKKWLAHSESFSKGEIHINECLSKTLDSEKAISILPIGITKIEGYFKADDIVKIIDHEGLQIGLGRAAYSSEEAEKFIGKNNKKPIIHYDYLYLEKQNY